MNLGLRPNEVSQLLLGRRTARQIRNRFDFLSRLSGRELKNILMNKETIKKKQLNRQKLKFKTKVLKLFANYGLVDRQTSHQNNITQQLALSVLQLMNYG